MRLGEGSFSYAQSIREWADPICFICCTGSMGLTADGDISRAAMVWGYWCCVYWYQACDREAFDAFNDFTLMFVLHLPGGFFTDAPKRTISQHGWNLHKLAKKEPEQSLAYCISLSGSNLWDSSFKQVLHMATSRYLPMKRSILQSRSCAWIPGLFLICVRASSRPSTGTANGKTSSWADSRIDICWSEIGPTYPSASAMGDIRRMVASSVAVMGRAGFSTPNANVQCFSLNVEAVLLYLNVFLVVHEVFKNQSCLGVSFFVGKP